MSTNIYLYMKLFFLSGSSYIMFFTPLSSLQVKNVLSLNCHFLIFQMIERSRVQILHSLL